MSKREFTNARLFDQRIRLERKTNSQDATTGFITESWATVATVWASINSQKLSERLKEPTIAGTLQSVYDYIITVRSDVMGRFSVTVNDRFDWNGTKLDIKDILDAQLRNRTTNIAVRVGLNDG